MKLPRPLFPIALVVLSVLAPVALSGSGSQPAAPTALPRGAASGIRAIEHRRDVQNVPPSEVPRQYSL